MKKQQVEILKDFQGYWEKNPKMTFGQVVEEISVECAAQAQDRDEEPADEFGRETDKHVAAALQHLVTR